MAIVATEGLSYISWCRWIKCDLVLKSKKNHKLIHHKVSSTIPGIPTIHFFALQSELTVDYKLTKSKRMPPADCCL